MFFIREPESGSPAQPRLRRVVRERLRRFVIPAGLRHVRHHPAAGVFERVLAGRITPRISILGTVFKLVPYPKGHLSWAPSLFCRILHLPNYLLGDACRRNPAFVPIERPGFSI